MVFDFAGGAGVPLLLEIGNGLFNHRTFTDGGVVVIAHHDIRMPIEVVIVNNDDGGILASQFVFDPLYDIISNQTDIPNTLGG